MRDTKGRFETAVSGLEMGNLGTRLPVPPPLFVKYRYLYLWGNSTDISLYWLKSDVESSRPVIPLLLQTSPRWLASRSLCPFPVTAPLVSISYDRNRNVFLALLSSCSFSYFSTTMSFGSLSPSLSSICSLKYAWIIVKFFCPVTSLIINGLTPSPINYNFIKLNSAAWLFSSTLLIPTAPMWPDSSLAPNTGSLFRSGSLTSLSLFPDAWALHAFWSYAPMIKYWVNQKQPSFTQTTFLTRSVLIAQSLWSRHHQIHTKIYHSKGYTKEVYTLSSLLTNR